MQSRKLQYYYTKLCLIIALETFFCMPGWTNDTIQCAHIQLTSIASDFVDCFYKDLSDPSNVRDIVLWSEHEDSLHYVLNLTYLSDSDYPIGYCVEWFLGLTQYSDIPVYCFGQANPFLGDSIGTQFLVVPKYRHSLCQEEWDPQGWKLTIHTDSTICWNRTAKDGIDAPIDSIVYAVSKYLKGVTFDRFEANFLSQRVSDFINIDSLNAWIQPSPFWLSIVGTPRSVQERNLLKSKKLVGRISLYVSELGIVTDYTFNEIAEIFHREKIDSLIGLLSEMSFEPARIKNHEVESVLILSVYE